MNVAFPALMGEFGVNTATVQWVTTGYLLVLSAIMPISSFLNRRYRARKLFLAAMITFLAGTIMSAAAPHFSLLIGGRILQGIGTGIALPLMFNIVLQQVPHERMGTMMGLATLITAIAPAVGPSLGGFLIGALGWRSIFLVLVPFLVIALVLGALTIRQAQETRRVSFAPVQFLLMAAGFVALIFATNAASTSAWTSPEVLGLFVLSVALIAGFVRLSRRSDDPLLRVRIFTDRTYALSIVYVVLIQAIVLALGYLIPYFAQVGKSMDSFAAGCLLLPGCIIGALLTPFGGGILDRFGPMRPILTDSAIGVVPFVLFAVLGVHGSGVRLALIYALFPICQGMSVSNSMTNGLRSLPDDLQADSNAAFNTIQQLGGAIRTAVVTAIVNAAEAADPVAGTATGTQLSFHVLTGQGRFVAGKAMGGGMLETPAGFPCRAVVEREEAFMTGETVIAVPDPDVRVELPGGFVVDTDRGRLDLERVHRWLSTDAYWALGRSRDFVERAAAASVNFGVYGPDGAQVGYARVVTDGVAFGWLCDVYVAREVRGRGLGVALSRTVVETFRRLRLKRLMLITPDAHDLYAEVGFVSFPDPEKLMVLGPADR